MTRNCPHFFPGISLACVLWYVKRVGKISPLVRQIAPAHQSGGADPYSVQEEDLVGLILEFGKGFCLCSMSVVTRLILQQPWRRFGCYTQSATSESLTRIYGNAKFFRFSTAVASADDELKHENESFLTGTSSIYAEEMYERYTNDPNSVHESWKHYFDALSSGKAYDPSAYNKPTAAVVVGTKLPTATTSSLSQSTVAAAAVAPSDSLGVAHLIRAYQVNGHTAAKLDPLHTYAPESFPYRPRPVTENESDPDYGYPPELTPAYHGFHSSDLDRVMNFRGTSSGGNKGYLEDLASSPNKVTLRMILNELRKNYTGTLGVEYMVRIGLRYHLSTLTRT
jgi:2-oxoglutarate dehydrogenase N-terminus